MVSLPIPLHKWEKQEGYMIQYHLNDEYNNYRLKINKIRETDRIADLRVRIQEMYGFDPNTYLVAWVYDNKMVKIFNN